jgi:hypothetical protein
MLGLVRLPKRRDYWRRGSAWQIDSAPIGMPDIIPKRTGIDSFSDIQMIGIICFFATRIAGRQRTLVLALE